MTSSVVNVNEYQSLAKQKMSKVFYDFYASAAEDGWTERENRDAYSRIRILPRVLVDVSTVDLSTTVLGTKISSPVMVAPSSLHKLAHPEGELATARAAAAANTIMVLSTSASSTMEEVAQAASGVRFFQITMITKAKTLELIKRAEQAGYAALVVTIDTPILGRREDDLRNRFSLPPDVSTKMLDDLIISVQNTTVAENESQFSSLAAAFLDRKASWKDIEWLKNSTKLPVLLKGILTKEATEKAVEAGVAGIVVSNHGGRQLDHVPATISVLEEVVTAAGGKFPVYVDGGIRRGTDVFKAMALGASGVFIGRPPLFGLAVDGEAGVKKVLDMLKDELKTTMMLAGCPTIQSIGRSQVQTEEDRAKQLRVPSPVTQDRHTGTPGSFCVFDQRTSVELQDVHDARTETVASRRSSSRTCPCRTPP